MFHHFRCTDSDFKKSISIAEKNKEIKKNIISYNILSFHFYKDVIHKKSQRAVRNFNKAVKD